MISERTSRENNSSAVRRASLPTFSRSAGSSLSVSSISKASCWVSNKNPLRPSSIHSTYPPPLVAHHRQPAGHRFCYHSPRRFKVVLRGAVEEAVQPLQKQVRFLGIGRQ